MASFDGMSAQQRLLFDLFSSTPVIMPGRNRFEDRVAALLKDLPRLTEAEVVAAGERDGSCSVCYVPYLAILAEEETASAMDTPAQPLEHHGLTKLSKPWQCGHIFCRKE
ncbi:hypothetical protein CC2G_010585 [Coprinopsis cinerea AmutBmut pab1-1]|nr:hypothetical protein CC2G_010585 [Coprinopsis cinerea AmutBmut pab1-1]